MKTKHTPGPWVCLPKEADKDYIRVRGTCLGGRYKVANVPTPTYEGVHEREVQETRCNALIISAAPELLEALRDMVSDHASPSPRTLAFARAAIAKATGRTG